jgi:hypothetical protein
MSYKSDRFRTALNVKQKLKTYVTQIRPDKSTITDDGMIKPFLWFLSQNPIYVFSRNNFTKLIT